MRTFLLLFFLMGSYIGFAQTITGTVIDSETQMPLPGANIIETGTSHGTVTDFDGNFKLDVRSQSGSITISYIGYESERIAYKGSADIGRIALMPDADALSEVVIVGHGIIDMASDRQTPIAVSTITSADIQSKAVGNVEFPEVMKSTPSVYVSNQSGG